MKRKINTLKKELTCQKKYTFAYKENQISYIVP